MASGVCSLRRPELYQVKGLMDVDSGACPSQYLASVLCLGSWLAVLVCALGL